MPRPTRQSPERGDARTRLLEAARDLIRQRGFNATSVEDLCAMAEVTKGSFFYHFQSKEMLGVAAADFWAETTSAFFAAAPYHQPADPLDRILAYIAFRRAIIQGEIAQFSCLVGTMVQEAHQDWPAIRAACGDSILGHAATLEPDFAAAITASGLTGLPSPASLARHSQTVIQGAFIMAKAGDDADLAREALDHLDRYIRCLFKRPIKEETT